VKDGEAELAGHSFDIVFGLILFSFSVLFVIANGTTVAGIALQVCVSLPISCSRTSPPQI
jgi:hypothetical protein